MTAAPTLLDKWLFIGAVMADPDLSDLARRIAYLLTELFDERRGGAWPSLDTIQTRTGASRQGCLNAIRQLEDGAWFTKKAGHGRVSSVYTPRWDRLGTALTDDGEDTVSVNLGGPKPAEDSVNPDGPKLDVSVNSGGPKEPSFGLVLHAVSVNSSRPDSTYRLPLEGRYLFSDDRMQSGGNTVQTTVKQKPQPAENIEADFWEWYAAYPRKVDPKKASSAYRKARKEGASVADLLEGARRYANQVRAEGRDRKFIKHPASWLNAGSWANEPEAGATVIPLPKASSPTMAAAADLFNDTPEAHREREKFRL